MKVFKCSPKKNEDGFAIRDTVQLFVVVQKWFNAVNQSWMHLVHFVKDEHGAFAVGDVAFDPLL